MAGFDNHSFCARCRDKGKGKVPCVENTDTTDCEFCNIPTPDLGAQLSTLSYDIKKKKYEAKKMDLYSTPVENIQNHSIPPL